MIKLPRELSDFYKIKKGDKFKLIVEMPENEKEPPKNRFEIVKENAKI